MQLRDFVCVALLCVSNFGAHAQHEANAAKSKLGDGYLKRDLTSYFCKGRKDCRVEYEYLRKGATQSGVSYPKYYLWVKWYSNRLTTEGATRVSAIEETRFDVTDFLSAADIVASPETVRDVFPDTLVDNIIQRAHQQESHK